MSERNDILYFIKSINLKNKCTEDHITTNITINELDEIHLSVLTN